MTTITYKKHLAKIILLISVIGLLSSCISPKETNLLQPDQKPYYSVKPYEDYRIRVNDELYCNILTMDAAFIEEFSQAFSGIISTSGISESGRNRYDQTAYTVYNNGSISIPFFGEIKVEGLTISEAESVIQKKMKASFPDAEIRIRMKNNVFYIVSNKKNGIYSIFKDNMTIYQALSLSGNISEEMDLSKVKIVRLDKDGKSTVVKTFNLRTESVIESEYYYIQPNDVIYYSTSKSSFFRVSSFSSLFATILTPVTFLVSMLAFDIK